MKPARNMLAGAVVAFATGLGASADPVKIGFNVPLAGLAAADGNSRPDPA